MAQLNDVDVAVIGGGCIGLGLAARLAEEYESVVLFDRDYPGLEATGAAGGMLAPIMELEFDEFELLELGRASLDQFPAYVRELESTTEMDVGLREWGTLFVALYERQVEELERLYEYQQRLGLEVEKLPAGRLLDQAPELSEQVVEGLRITDEKHVDNRKFSAALRVLCRQRNVRIHSNDPVVELNYDGAGRIDRIVSNFSEVRPERVVVAAGAWSGQLPGLKEADQLPVRPVKGQAAAVQLTPDFVPGSIIQTPEVYCVPHYPDRLLLGATMEEKGFERRPRVGGVYDMLFAGAEVLPDLKRQPFLETWVGHRPASFDSLPVIGPSCVTENLYFATGHYRNGILMTPITVDLLSAVIVNDATPALLEPFLPARFA